MMSDLPPLVDSGAPLLSVWRLPATQFVTEKQYRVLNASSRVVAHATARLIGDVTVVASTLFGKDVILRGDLGPIRFGPLVVVDNEAIVRPTVRCLPGRGTAEVIPLQVGSGCYIGRRCVIEAVSIGALVIVEADVSIGSGSVVGDCV